MKKTVLIVDDEPLIRLTLNDYLTQQKFNIIEAADGSEAFDLFRKHKIDLIISDVRMPKMNGIELLRKVKTVSKHTPVVLITAYRPTKQQEEVMVTKADGYLMKPFALRSLMQMIMDLI